MRSAFSNTNRRCTVLWVLHPLVVVSETSISCSSSRSNLIHAKNSRTSDTSLPWDGPQKLQAKLRLSEPSFRSRQGQPQFVNHEGVAYFALHRVSITLRCGCLAPHSRGPCERVASRLGRNVLPRLASFARHRGSETGLLGGIISAARTGTQSPSSSFALVGRPVLPPPPVRKFCFVRAAILV